MALKEALWAGEAAGVPVEGLHPVQGGAASLTSVSSSTHEGAGSLQHRGCVCTGAGKHELVKCKIRQLPEPKAARLAGLQSGAAHQRPDAHVSTFRVSGISVLPPATESQSCHPHRHSCSQPGGPAPEYARGPPGAGTKAERPAALSVRKAAGPPRGCGSPAAAGKAGAFPMASFLHPHLHLSFPGGL